MSCKPKRTCGPQKPRCRKASDLEPAGCGIELLFIFIGLVGLAVWCGCGGLLLKLLGV